MMSDISQWRAVDADNSAPPPDGWPEGQPASTVNDSARANMGGARRQWEDKEFFDRGTLSTETLNDTNEHVTVIDGTSFSVPGDKTLIYHVERRVRAVGSSTGTIHGEITAAVFATDTTVTVVWDSGALVSEPVTVSLGSSVTGSPVSAGSVGLSPEIDFAYPIGAVTPFAGTTEPSGYLFCDGRSLDASVATGDPSLQSLFDVIGTTYGGSGNAAFNIPDIRGRVVAGREDTPILLTPGGSGISGNALNSKGGTETHILVTSQMPSHVHQFNKRITTGGTPAEGFQFLDPVAPHELTNTTATGGDAAHQNTQPTIVLNYIIKSK